MTDILLLSDIKVKMLNTYMPNNQTLNRIANFFSAFADPTRVKILTALCISDMCVNDLAVVLDLNQTTVSHQLKILKESGVVDCNRYGKIVYYSLIDAGINKIISSGVDYLLNE